MSRAVPTLSILATVAVLVYFQDEPCAAETRREPESALAMS